jgi:hypothetical protein
VAAMFSRSCSRPCRCVRWVRSRSAAPPHMWAGTVSQETGVSGNEDACRWPHVSSPNCREWRRASGRAGPGPDLRWPASPIGSP